MASDLITKIVTDTVPVRASAACDRLLPEDVRKRLDAEDLNPDMRENCAPGVCRFCKATLPATHLRFPLPHGEFLMPLLQCDRAAQLWDRAEAIRQQRIADSLKRKAALVETGKSKQRRDYFSDDNP